MAYFTLLWKARTIENYRLNYEREKLNSIRITSTQNPKRTLYQKWRLYNLNTKRRLSKALLRHYPEGSTIYNFFYYLRTDQTFPNFLLKSVIGFVGGIILTYLCFMFFVFQLSISLIHATIMSSIIGVLLTLGLAFSYRIRCLVFLLIPQFFSRIGRYTLTCYALVLILTGPATNTLKNSEVLSESLACEQEQIKNNMRQINESMQKPFDAMSRSLRLVIDSLKKLADKLKFVTIRIKRLALSIAHSLQASYDWLSSTVDTCNAKLGTPYKYCCRAVATSANDCQATFGPHFAHICNVIHLTELLCRPVQLPTYFCHVIDLANVNVLGAVTKNLKVFTARIKSMVHMDINVHHSFIFSSNSSKSASQAAAGIVTEIRNRADPLLTWLSWSSCVTSLSLLLIISRAKYYQHMFETRSRFDNRYVTKELRCLDLRRLRQGKATVLPLNRREEQKYIKTTSFRLVSSEKVHISRSAVTMAITTFKLMIHMVADYSLYWVLMTIRYHGRMQTPLPPGSPDASFYLAGSGLVSKILRSLIGSISLPLTARPPSPVTCLPNPHPPDFHRYSQIGILIVLLWFLALFEPYGLRLRHVIMGLYRPERAKARAAWLYNHIQTTRGSFMKFARRKLHREYKSLSEEKHTFRRWLNAHIPCVCLKDLLGISPDEPHCFLCGIIESCNECDRSLTRCETPNCPGTYCKKCFSDIGQMCTICLSPADYGDFSDVSMEKGSSDESDSDEGSDDIHLHQLNANDIETQYNAMEEGRSTSPNNKYKKNVDPTSKNSNVKDPNDDFSSKSNEGKELEEMGVLDKGKVNKALTVRQKKYVDIDLNNFKRNGIASLGEDTIYSICCSYHNCNLIRNSTVCVMNSQFDRFTDKNVKGNDKVNVVGLKRNTGDESRRTDSFLFSSPRASEVRSEQYIARLLQRFSSLRKYAVKKTYSSRKIPNRGHICRSLSMELDTPKSIRSRSRKRRKKVYRSKQPDSITPQNTAVTNKVENSPRSNKRAEFLQKPYLVYLQKYPTKRKQSVQLTKVKRKISAIVFHLRRRRITSESQKKWNSRIKRTAVPTKEEIMTKHVMKSAENFIAEPKIVKQAAEKNNKKPSQSKNIERDVKDDEEITIKYVESKKTRHGVGKLYDIYSDYWKNMKLYAPVCIVNFFKGEHSPIDYGKTNHKTRKKLEASMRQKIRKDNEATRKYRISSFLNEQDWMKRRYQKDKSGVNLAAADEATQNTEASLLEKNGQGHAVNKRRGKPAKHYNDDILTTMLEENGTGDSNLQNHQKKHVPREVSSSSPLQNSELLIATSTDNLRFDDETNGRSQTYKLGMPRSLKYFRAIGHRDFDPAEEMFCDAYDYNTSNHHKVNYPENTFNYKHSLREVNSSAMKEDRNALVSPQAVTQSPHEIDHVKIDENLKKEGSSKKLECNDGELVNKNETTIENEKWVNMEKKGRCLFSFLFPCCGRKKCKKVTADVEIEVSPILKSRSCQYMVRSQKCKDTQVYNMKEVSQSISHDMVREIGVCATHETCTCATQAHRRYKNAATSPTSKPQDKSSRNSVKDAATINYNAQEVKQKTGLGIPKKIGGKANNNTAVQFPVQPKRSPGRPKDPHLSSTESIISFDTLTSISSIRSDEESRADTTRTDTTVYSLSAAYDHESPRRRKYRIRVTTKANSNTLCKLVGRQRQNTEGYLTLARSQVTGGARY